MGRLVSATDFQKTLSFGYDALGRTVAQTSRWGTVGSTFDLAGRRTRITHPDGYFVDQDYLVTGEMTRIRENGATSGVGVLATFGYDPASSAGQAGRRTSLTRGNGTVTSYSYDPVSRLSQLVQDVPDATRDLTLGFSYNPASQIVSNTRSNDLFATTPVAGTQTAVPDGLNRIVELNGTNLSHDARGNMTFDGTTSYAYTSDNLMTTGAGVQLYYDPLNRLVQVTGSPVTRFTYDGADLIAEWDGSNNFLRRYVHGPGIDEPLVRYEGPGISNRTYFHADERGSIVAHSDSNANVTQVNRYDEYGVPATGNAGRFQYTGQPWIGEIGLYYYRARMYNPLRGGRFMQTDPIGYGDGMNMYAYVRGDPVNRVDPSGMAGCRFGDLEEGDLPVCGDPPEPAPAIAGNGAQNTGGCDVPSPVVTLCAVGEAGGGGGEVVTRRPIQLAALQEQRRPRQRRRPTVREQNCAYSTGAVVAGSALLAVAGSAGVAALVPSPGTLGLGAFAVVAGGAGAIFAGIGTIGMIASCD